ncbi:hypothetical protein SDC9_163037 [bioreactor metagenome]|uniref:Uncharacterized protein n=1 Tax=bioreactor metagenome TaxID=1076179 RepID=A0A645FUC8_9ZZZZ
MPSAVVHRDFPSVTAKKLMDRPIDRFTEDVPQGNVYGRKSPHRDASPVEPDRPGLIHFMPETFDVEGLTQQYLF